jgi:hypothetical protein
MNICTTTVLYLISVFAGGVLAETWVDFMRRGFDKNYDPTVRRTHRLNWSIGILERAICTTLVIWTPSLVPGFVGGWITLKFAANWKMRHEGDPEMDARNRLASLVGMVISFTVAIACGLFAHPSSLKAWSN